MNKRTTKYIVLNLTSMSDASIPKPKNIAGRN